MDYKVIFDVIEHGYTSWRMALPFAGISVAATCISWVLSRPSMIEDTREDRIRRAGFRVVAAATGVIAIGLIGYTYRAHLVLCDAFRSGKGHVIEGIVTAFIPEGPDGHPLEQFRVAGEDFWYSSSNGTSGFHWTVGKGGPMRNGLKVRITTVGEEIARLEIAP